MVLLALVRRGVAVRGLVHSTAEIHKVKQAGATETVVADFNDIGALIKAADGVDGVFGIIPAFAQSSATIGVNMVKAAIRGGARKFVFSSVYHPTLSALSNHHDKQLAEAVLYESELDYTILQPAVFMQQLRSLCQTAKATGFIAQAYSADARMAYVHYRDVAEIVAESFVSDRFLHCTFELAASGMYSRNDLADLWRRPWAGPSPHKAWTFSCRLTAFSYPLGRYARASGR